MKRVYEYDGSITVSCYGVKETWLSNFKGETTAKSKEQAITFLIYRAKAEGLAKGYTLKNGSKLSLNKQLIVERK